jgi:hypothetical protein
MKTYDEYKSDDVIDFTKYKIIVPSEKDKTGRSRIYVETDNDRIFGFKLYTDNSLEILENKTTVNDFNTDEKE